jgi:hypothetical protein
MLPQTTNLIGPRRKVNLPLTKKMIKKTTTTSLTVMRVQRKKRTITCKMSCPRRNRLALKRRNLKNLKLLNQKRRKLYKLK